MKRVLLAFTGTISIYAASEPGKSVIEVCFTEEACDKLLVDDKTINALEVERWALERQDEHKTRRDTN